MQSEKTRLDFEMIDIVKIDLIMRLISVYFDGLCQPRNPGGIACYAFLARRNDTIMHSEYGIVGEPFSKDATNNVAEYTALIKGLEWLTEHAAKDEPIMVYGDSKLVVSQMNGDYRIRSKRISPYYRRAISLRNAFQGIEIAWIPREKNNEADALTNKAYREALAQWTGRRTKSRSS